MTDATIVVAGAGPVGSCLAIEAARRGVHVTVVEPRAAGEPPSAKCNTVAARTLETFRRFDIADTVRAAELPEDSEPRLLGCALPDVDGQHVERVLPPLR